MPIHATYDTTFPWSQRSHLTPFLAVGCVARICTQVVSDQRVGQNNRISITRGDQIHLLHDNLDSRTELHAKAELERLWAAQASVQSPTPFHVAFQYLSITRNFPCCRPRSGAVCETVF